MFGRCISGTFVFLACFSAPYISTNEMILKMFLLGLVVGCYNTVQITLLFFQPLYSIMYLKEEADLQYDFWNKPTSRLAGSETTPIGGSAGGNNTLGSGQTEVKQRQTLSSSIRTVNSSHL
jgi:hypothetical protein